MIYLKRFHFLTRTMEDDFFFEQKMTCYDSFYPYRVLSRHQFEQIDFEPVTILYGGNGCGKSTALNIIAEKLGLSRDTLYNRSSFFDTYVEACKYEACKKLPAGSRIITSDGVFDYMINVRGINDGIDRRRDELFDEYQNIKKNAREFRFESLDDYDELRMINSVRQNTMSKYARKNLVENIREHSNGESALLHFADRIRENALYLLDEPENSLSPEKQLELVDFLTDSVRFYNCQLVIATHSPFLLSMKGAKIYDLDEYRVDVKKWTELKNVRAYYEFFKKHEDDFL